MQSTKPILYIIVNNHFDPTWRRAWDRRFTFKGETYVSYADLEEFYLLDNLELARAHPDYRFEAESVIVARKFLERHPERLEELQELARQGRFAVPGAGEAIIDANMVLGESLVRNYVMGILWVEQTLGAGTRLAIRNDAFGNSAQLPQILRGCEIAWATGMSYSPAHGKYWRGLDGSVIVHATLPIAAQGGGNTKYPPCPVCHGQALNGVPCVACAGRGIDLFERAWLPKEIKSEALATYGAGRVPMTPEELLPNPELLAWAGQMREHYDVRFALEEDMLLHIQPWLGAVDSPPEQDVHDGVELNPNNSGCWVSRIKTKQNVRRQEYALLATEALQVMAACAGAAYPRTALAAVWQKMFLAMFHDAITGTHVDAAYAELEDTWQRIDAETAALRHQALARLVAPHPTTISVLNPGGHVTTQIATAVLPASPAQVLITDGAGQAQPLLSTRQLEHGQMAIEFVASAIPALGARTYRVLSSGSDPNQLALLDQPVIENQRFRIEADEQGLLSVFDKRLGLDILKADQMYRPGELILEHDEGSPWATLHPDQSRTPLAGCTRLLAAESGAAFQRLVFEVNPPYNAGFAGRGLRAHLTVSLVEAIDRVDFHLRVYWNTFNHRLRVAMPVPFAGKHLYEIPYGQLERRPYTPTFAWAGANGDWPAVNWAGVQGERASVALFNRGLPAYCIEAGQPQGEVLLLSVLRSPAVPTYLHEPEFYTMTDWDGMRDAGEHDFDFAIAAYAAPLAESDVVFEAEGYNAGLVAVAGEAHLPDLPRVESNVARLAALKWAEQGRALILRVCEFRGQGGEVEITLPSGIERAERVNLLERQAQTLEIKAQRTSVLLRPWEIATLRLIV
jgi:alpha-mannosidase